MGLVCYGYKCILLYIKLILCSGVVVLRRSMLDLRRGYIRLSVYVHSFMCETYLV